MFLIDFVIKSKKCSIFVQKIFDNVLFLFYCFFIIKIGGIKMNKTISFEDVLIFFTAIAAVLSLFMMIVVICLSGTKYLAFIFFNIMLVVGAWILDYKGINPKSMLKFCLHR